jgi:DNA-binding beta-propeller fold protein YncE
MLCNWKGIRSFLISVGLGIGVAIALVISVGRPKAYASKVESLAARIAPGDTPLNLIETPNGFLISTNSGFGAEYLQAYDERRKKISDRLDLRSVWYGLAYVPARKLLLASSGRSSVFLIPFASGRFGKPREITLARCALTAGVAVLDESTAVVACNQNREVLKFNIDTGAVLDRAQVGEYPYEVKRLPGGRIAVSDWGQSSVSILEGSNLKVLGTIPVGSHPNDMLILPRGSQLLVACSDSDDLYVIDLESLREVRRVDFHIPGSRLGGAQPDALAFDPGNHRIFVALAAVNAVAVFDVSRGHDDELSFQGLIPVGTYPTALLHSPQGQLFIADGRNAVAGPSSPTRAIYRNNPPVRAYKSNSGSPLTYIGFLLGGGIEAVSDSDYGKLRTRIVGLARQVYGENRRKVPLQSLELIRYFSSKSNPHDPIRHVIYIIKENRTYDQVFGDIKRGNGDRNLVLFGEPVTPNGHALVRQFALYDNFYVSGDVSWDGHLWSMGAQATDYIEKLWPSAYAGRSEVIHMWESDYRGDKQHPHPIAVPGAGLLWDRAHEAGITYRDYGEWVRDDKNHPGDSIAYLPVLQGHYDRRYEAAGIGEITDRKREAEWQREFSHFETTGELPQLEVVYFPNDHTLGTRPGAHTPTAMVADNDVAVGRLVEAVSHSRFWASTAIFALEDDSQDGPDHVDAHRSTLLVISPYVRHGAVIHTHFSTVSVLKTIEQILGLRSLSYFDDRATSLLVDFQKQPVLDTFTSLKPKVNMNSTNSSDAPGSKESASWDFSEPDMAPAAQLNRIIWQSIKGKGSESPPPVFSVQSAAAATRDSTTGH